MSAWVWVGVALLGGVGANARFLVHLLVSARAGTEFPFGTLVVNASGSLLLGLLTGLAIGGNALVLAGTATLGSYTTFSTWMLDTHRLAERGGGAVGERRRGLAVLNVLISLALGIGAVAVGRAIGSGL
jgi:CrcB protein